MRKADAVLTALALVAVAATAAGAWRGASWTDERTLHFASHAEPLAAGAPTPATGAGAFFNWTVPDNSTAANLTVKVTFTGQALRGGVATVSLRLATPDGASQPPATKPLPIGQGATSAGLTVPLNATWEAMPSELRDTTDLGHGRSWPHALSLSVTVEAPPGDLPLARYGFQASVEGTVLVYKQAP